MNDETSFWDNFDLYSLAQNVALAVAILILTWLVARVVRWAFGSLTKRVPALQHEGDNGASVGDSLGQIAALLVWLFGLVAVLQVFALDQVLAPIQTLLTNVMDYVPNIIGAAFVFFVGALIAKIVRQLTQTTLSTVRFDRWANRGGAEDLTGNATISRTIASVLYALVMIVVSIAALQVLGISSISDPAEQMLSTVFDAVPRVIAAALILGLGLLVARFVAGLLADVLDGLGTDRALHSLEIMPSGSPSAVLVRVAQVAIMLFFAVGATRVLDFPEITALLDQVLVVGGSVVFGAAIIAAGYLVARILSGIPQDGLASRILFYSTLVLFTAIGLKAMGIADSIIELAFGALVVGGAAAAALAFGLGGRDAAAKALADLRREQGSASTPAE